MSSIGVWPRLLTGLVGHIADPHQWAIDALSNGIIRTAHALKHETFNPTVRAPEEAENCVGVVIEAGVGERGIARSRQSLRHDRHAVSVGGTQDDFDLGVVGGVNGIGIRNRARLAVTVEGDVVIRYHGRAIHGRQQVLRGDT